MGYSKLQTKGYTLRVTLKNGLIHIKQTGKWGVTLGILDIPTLGLPTDPYLLHEALIAKMTPETTEELALCSRMADEVAAKLKEIYKVQLTQS